MDILLDGNTLLNKEQLFKSLKEQIHSDEFIGSNLDALYDVLSTNTEKVVITIINSNQLETNLVHYYPKLINLFKELEQTENDFSFFIK